MSLEWPFRRDARRELSDGYLSVAYSYSHLDLALLAPLMHDRRFSDLLDFRSTRYLSITYYVACVKPEDLRSFTDREDFNRSVFLLAINR
jgi:hypothetical protein